jgi:bifunctional non-homologous end joining protein LigD
LSGGNLGGSTREAQCPRKDLPRIPTRAHKPPAGPGWVHGIKHDGYRLQVRRDGDAVRLFTRRGYDWSGRYPAIAVTAAKLARSFTLDGEAAVCGPNGVAIFDALHRRGTVSVAMLYAFGDRKRRQRSY